MQDTNLKINQDHQSYLCMKKFYSDLNKIKHINKNFSITEFACGASKILKKKILNLISIKN